MDTASNTGDSRPQRRRGASTLILEALLVAAVGLVVGLAANALSPRGLRLDRDYFPTAMAPAKGPGASAVEATPAKSTATPPTALATGLVSGALAGTGSVAAPVASAAGAGKPGDIVQQLHQRGLQTVSSNEVIAAFRDPQFEQGLTVFVDARDDAHYAEGHIPGAWQFHHYRAENYLPTVLPVCLSALKIIIYCSGGECEDSAFAAVVLGDAGVPRNTLFVYPGGITEWKSLGLPVEAGARGSGEIKGASR